MAEKTFYKGPLSSETLFNLVMRLWKMELEGGIIIHFIHVSGKRMFASEREVLSKEDTTKGVMQGNNLLTYFPFHLSADQRSGELAPWINMWSSRNQSLTVLSAYRWFDRVFDEGNYLLTHPLPVSQIAVKQICRTYYLREKSLNIL